MNPPAPRRPETARTEVVLDITRLMSRAGFRAPTGVDRVEMAYARKLLAAIPDRLSFAGAHPALGYGRIPTPAAKAFIEETARAWRGDSQPGGGTTPGTSGSLAPLWRVRPRLRRPQAPPHDLRRVYLLASPHHLDRPGRIRSILRRERARFVCLLHDLIPIEFPEYASASGTQRHLRRMATLAEHADGIVAVSQAARQSLLAHHTPRAQVHAALLGVETDAGRAKASPRRDDRPYFVMVGTIEPRKNHLLLLNLWRRLVAEFGADAAPRLHLIGRRGWENENIVDMLDRCAGLKGVVVEHGQASDQTMWDLIRGARALLMPSFAEGFGLPVAEALQLGAPVLCSDIPAHREVAGEAAEFLDPLDGPAWRQAVIDYARPDSARRRLGLERMQRWRAPTWDAHVKTVLDLIEEVGR